MTQQKKKSEERANQNDRELGMEKSEKNNDLQ